MSRPVSNPKDREPTWVSLVLAQLVKADDFMTPDQLRVAVGAKTMRPVAAALWWLSKNHAVESVVGGDGKLWWFATGSDDRQRALEARIKEPVGNRGGDPLGRRVSRKKKTQPE